MASIGNNESQLFGITLTDVVQSRVKHGRCYINNCGDQHLLDCISCKRHDLCFSHMGGSGFTRVYCPNCLKVMMLRRQTLENERETQQQQ